MAITLSASKSIESYLEGEAEYLLTYKAKISVDLLHLPSPDFIDRIFVQSDRRPQVLRSLQQLYGNGRLANTVELMKRFIVSYLAIILSI